MRILLLILLSFLLATSSLAQLASEQSQLLLPQPTDHKMGKEDAPVSLIIYSSLSCPHCATLNQSILPKIEENFVKTGKTLLIHRDIPFDKYGLQASMLVNCVNEEQYFTFLNVLFKKQSHWTFKKNSIEILEHIARLGGISGEQFHQCMDNTDLQEKIVTYRQKAHETLDLKGVPSIYINGAFYQGELSEKGLSDAIQRELSFTSK